MLGTVRATDLLQLVGLQDLGDGHGETQRLTQISVLLLQSHQAAAKQVLVHLEGRNTMKASEPGRQPVCLSVCLSVYLSVCLSVCVTFLRDRGVLLW